MVTGTSRRGGSLRRKNDVTHEGRKTRTPLRDLPELRFSGPHRPATLRQGVRDSCGRRPRVHLSGVWYEGHLHESRVPHRHKLTSAFMTRAFLCGGICTTSSMLTPGNFVWDIFSRMNSSSAVNVTWVPPYGLDGLRVGRPVRPVETTATAHATRASSPNPLATAGVLTPSFSMTPARLAPTTPPR
jgi:hypothetical protein